ncbi:MAG: DinB family protein [Acidobacteriota bacterium]
MERRFRYDDWANREEVARLRAMAPPPPRAVRILAHIVGTQWVWLQRLRGGPPAVVWPEWTLDECERQLDLLREEWRVPVRVTEITYTNSLGERWTSRADDVLTHVILHGGYHRGQIALIIRDAGETPAYTDFIHCTRAGLLSD